MSTYDRLGVSIWASNLAVIRAARLKLTKIVRCHKEYRRARHLFYRQMLHEHHMARDLALHFRL